MTKSKNSALPDLAKTITNSPYDFTHLATFKPKASSTLNPNNLESIPCKIYVFLISSVSSARISLNYALDLSKLINLIQFDLVADLFRKSRYNPDLKNKFKEL